MKTRFSLSRRAALKGAGGFTLSLPLLEVMLESKAYAQAAAPSRYMVFFDGQSLGADGDPKHNEFVPDKVGTDYDLKTATLPLGALKSEVSVVSGLKIPWAAENGGMVPAGGRSDQHHVQSLSPLLSGMRSSAATSRSQGPTSDQVVADFLAGSTTFKSVSYRVQADWYLTGSEPAGRDVISYRRAMNGSLQQIPGEVSPQAAFRSLFGTFTPPGVDPAAAAKFDFEQRSRRSVLDLVRGDTERLVPKLGTADKQRLQRHLDELRDLERRVAAIPPPQTSVCVRPMDPGADPPVGQPQANVGGENQYSVNLGASNEDVRAKTFIDLIAMAYACDLTRVVALQMTMFQSHLNMYSLTGQSTDCHELGHGGVPGGTNAVSKGIAWHMKHFAYLLQKLKDTPEAGGTLLDHCAIAYLLEGGHGWDPEGVKPNSSHSTENMAVLLAGRAGGLKPGQHVVATGRHPASVLITAMKAVGGTSETLGEVTGDIPQLRMG